MAATVIEGDAAAVLASLPARSVHAIVTSPPYYGLRDYGTEGQIGLEGSPDQYAERLVEAFHAARRVLRDDGTLWLNLGDSYASVPGKGSNVPQTKGGTPAYPSSAPHRSRPIEGVKPKDLLGIPWLVAFALRADGWYLRSEVIWRKPNPMPESVADRPTRSHEQVFLFAKRARYYYDQHAIAEPASWDRTRDGTRNARDVWTVATQAYAGAHFAVFPPRLIEPMILAATPPRCCADCGHPYQRHVERTPMARRPVSPQAAARRQAMGEHARIAAPQQDAPAAAVHRAWLPGCEHDAPAIPATVLDPFAGSGTTSVVAQWHGRDSIAIELSADYARMARERIAAEGRPGGPARNEHETPIEGQTALDV